MKSELLHSQPEYETPSGSRHFNCGDNVAWRDPLAGAETDRGVVVVIKNDWYIVWRSGELQSFDDISGTCLKVVSWWSGL